MDRDRLPELVRDVDPRLPFSEGKGFEAGDVLEAAGGPVHLDPVGAGAELCPRHAHHLVDTVSAAAAGRTRAWSAARDAETVAGDEHARTDHRAAIDQIAHRD